MMFNYIVVNKTANKERFVNKTYGTVLSHPRQSASKSSSDQLDGMGDTQ